MALDGKVVEASAVAEVRSLVALLLMRMPPLLPDAPKGLACMHAATHVYVLVDKHDVPCAAS